MVGILGFGILGLHSLVDMEYSVCAAARNGSVAASPALEVGHLTASRQYIATRQQLVGLDQMQVQCWQCAQQTLQQ